MRLTTQLKRETVLNQLKRNAGEVELSCKNTGIVKSTFYKWLKEDEAFKQAVTEVYKEVENFAISKLYQKALEDDIQALCCVCNRSSRKLG